jgi:hypothetical protein
MRTSQHYSAPAIGQHFSNWPFQSHHQSGRITIIRRRFRWNLVGRMMAEHKSARSRSRAACQFCRARKLKCDNLEPTCSACKARNISCEYVIRAPAPRPSNAAIQALQNEVARLRRVLDQANVKVEDAIDVDAGAEDGSPRPSSSSHAQALTSPVFSDETHSLRRQSEADQMFDPQLQSMETPGGLNQPFTQNFVVSTTPIHLTLE